MTDEQIHKLSSHIKKLEAAEQTVKDAEINLQGAKANRDKIAKSLERLRSGEAPARNTSADQA